MRTFVLQRIAHAIVLLIGVVTISFALMQRVPGDFLNTLGENPLITQPMLDAMSHRLGLDRPWWIQYVLYFKNVILHLDFGPSFSYQRPVFSVLREGLLNTLLLQFAALFVAWGLAIPLGVWVAVRQHSWIDKGISFVSYIGLSIPEVLLAMLLVMVAVRTGLFPSGGMRSVDWDRLGPGGKALDLLWHLALPALVVASVPLAARIRQMRASLLDVLRLEYITTARAKGLDERSVFFKHALRNALNPLITLFGFSLGGLISGSLVAELVFSWPGIGRITYEALWTQDQYLALGGLWMVSAMLVLGNLVADLLLAAADPRIAYE